jgi:hypothetical protein
MATQKRWKANGINRVVEENNAETENSLRLSQKENRRRKPGAVSFENLTVRVTERNNR